MRDQVKEVFDALASKNKLTAEAVVKEARRKGSPLHDLFDWNDASAAHRSRLHQARDLIREYTVNVTVRPGRAERVQAFVNVSHKHGSSNAAGAYEPRAAVLAESAKRSALVEKVLDQIERTLSLNGDLTELDDIRAACARVRARKVAA